MEERGTKTVGAVEMTSNLGTLLRMRDWAKNALSRTVERRISVRVFYRATVIITGE